MGRRVLVLCSACGTPARLNPRGEPDCLQDGEPLCWGCALEGYTAVHAKIVARDRANHAKHIADKRSAKARRQARAARSASPKARKGG